MLGSRIIKLIGTTFFVSMLTVPTASAHHGNDYGQKPCKPNKQNCSNHKPCEPNKHNCDNHKPHRPNNCSNKPNKPNCDNHRPHGPTTKPTVIKPIVVNPTVVRPHRPKYDRYYRDTLPKYAVMSVIAGISYAIVDNMYYEKRGNEYIYVEKPCCH